MKELKEGYAVTDRRFWADGSATDEVPEGEADALAPEPTPDAERLRTALADLEAAKHRVSRDQERQLDLFKGELVESLLPVLDNLERSIAAAAPGPWVEGVRLVHSQFLAALSKLGVERRSVLGKRFDPRVHDAVAVVPTNDPRQDGVVVAEIEPAYFFGDRVIRPAKVQVGRASRPTS